MEIAMAKKIISPIDKHVGNRFRTRGSNLGATNN